MMATRLVKRTRKTPAEAAKEPLQRLRENYPRRSTQPVSMAAAVTAYLAEFRKLSKSRRTRLQGALELALADIPGLEIAPGHVHVGSVGKDGMVHITVDSPTLAHELGVVYKRELLDNMRQLLQGKDSLAGITVKAAARRFKGRASPEAGT
jgi:hypothetical protein